MRTIRIRRLDLKCRGVSSAVAGGALRELHSALTRELSRSEKEDNRASVYSECAPIRMRPRATPAALAKAVAARVAGNVRARITHPS
jgi:hypothetical protein